MPDPKDYTQLTPASIECQCAFCGQMYRPKKRPTTTLYCSRECYQKMRQQCAVQYEEKSCEQCGALFGPKSRNDGGRFFRMTDFRNQRFCSVKCITDSQKQTIENVLTRLKLVNPQTGCEIWIGERNKKGYGVVSNEGHNQVVHRFIWQHFRGPVPDGMQLDHICGVKLCCNLDHLRVVTPRENSLADTSNCVSARNARKKVCPLCGGEYSFWPNGNRYCRPCRNRKSAAYLRRYRAAQKLIKGDS